VLGWNGVGIRKTTHPGGIEWGESVGENQPPQKPTKVKEGGEKNAGGSEDKFPCYSGGKEGTGSLRFTVKKEWGRKTLLHRGHGQEGGKKYEGYKRKNRGFFKTF